MNFPPDVPESDLAHLTLRVHSLLHGSLFRGTPVTGIGRAEFEVLGYFHARGGASVSQAAAELGMARPQISLNVERLVGKRLVRRVRLKEDRRVTHVTTTSRGERVLECAFAELSERVQRLFAGLNASEREHVRAAFELIVAPTAENIVRKERKP